MLDVSVIETVKEVICKLWLNDSKFEQTVIQQSLAVTYVGLFYHLVGRPKFCWQAKQMLANPAKKRSNIIQHHFRTIAIPIRDFQHF